MAAYCSVSMIATEAPLKISISRRLILVCVLSFWWGSAGAAQNACGLLWQVDPTSAPPSYLFGTIHSEDPRVLDLPGPVVRAFQSTSTYAMELLPDYAAMAAMTESMYFRDQRNLREVLGASLFERAAAALASHGIGSGLAMKMKPWAAAVTLSFPQPETGLFLDLMLYNRALRYEKGTIGLETAREQLDFFTALSMEEQIGLLRATLDHQDRMLSAYDDLIEAWLERDTAALISMNQKYLHELPENLAQRFKQEAIIGRNHRMAERVRPILATGDAFIAVGALHLYGPEGVIRLLRDSGYEVICIY